MAQSNVSRERRYAIKWLKRLPNDPGFVYRKFIVDGVDEAIFDINSSISDFETGGALHRRASALLRRALRDIPETPRLTVVLADFESFSEIEVAK